MAMNTAESLRISNLSSSLGALVSQLKLFSRDRVLRLIAGLMLDPHYHPNTLRLEVVLHLAWMHAEGSKGPKRDDVDRWLNQTMRKSYVSSLEDPAEDVFVGNVITRRGNNHVLMGVTEAGDFNVQQVLDVCYAMKAGDPTLEDIIAAAEAVLSLSHAATERAGLSRFAQSKGSSKEKLIGITAPKLERLAKAVTFDESDLRQLQIDPALLQQFVFDPEEIGNLATQTIGHSSADRYPIWRSGDMWLLAYPAGVTSAVRRFVLEKLKSAGHLQLFSDNLRSAQTSEIIALGLRPFGAEPVALDILPNLPAALGGVDILLCKYDVGKYGHVVIVHDDLDEFLAMGVTSVASSTKEYQRAFSEYLEKAAAAISELPDYTGGLSIVIVAGLGRGYMIGVPRLPKLWGHFVVRLSDLIDISWVEDISVLRLWKLMQQSAELEDSGTATTNVNGDVNLFAYWREKHYRLVLREYPFGGEGGLIHLATDFVTSLRQHVRCGYDKHAALRSNPLMWVAVQRTHLQTFFRETSRQPIYASVRRAMRGELHGLVETQQHSWWLTVDVPDKIAQHRGLIYSIWDGFLSWLVKLAPSWEAITNFIPKQPIVIRFTFVDLEKWDERDPSLLPVEMELPTTEIDHQRSEIHLQIPLSFFRAFQAVENVGERTIISILTQAVCDLGSAKITEEGTNAFTQAIVENDGARFIHLITARKFRDLVSDSLEKASFIPDEDIARSELGLGWLVRPRKTEGEILKDVKEANTLLHSLVDRIWIRIQARLKGIDRKSLAVKALLNIEQVASDREQWRRTARALLALHKDKDDVLRAARERESKRTATSLATRVLLEMGVCECPVVEGRPITQADFDALQADISVLINVANHSDAIRYEFLKPDTKIYPNGELDFDFADLAEVVGQYLSGYFNDQFQSAADAYEQNFDSGEPMGAAPLPEEFKDACKVEYGVSVEQIVNLSASLAKVALEDRRALYEQSETDLIKLISETQELSKPETETLISKLSLCPRDSWDSQFPAGFSGRDIWPWRFRRKLSLIARPLVRLAEGRDATFVVSPGLVEEAVRYLLDGTLRGDFPPEYYQTSEMRSWIGRARHERGRAFEEHVRTRFEELHYHARSGVQMSELGTKKEEGDLGDVDVLAWSDDGTIFVVECKSLQFAKTVSEIGEQLKQFRGEANDALARHLTRVNWLERHPETLRRVIQADAKTRCTIVSLLVTNTIVPMQFATGLPLDSKHIVPIKFIEPRLRVLKK